MYHHNFQRISKSLTQICNCTVSQAKTHTRINIKIGIAYSILLLVPYVIFPKLK